MGGGGIIGAFLYVVIIPLSVQRQHSVQSFYIAWGEVCCYKWFATYCITAPPVTGSLTPAQPDNTHSPLAPKHKKSGP